MILTSLLNGRKYVPFHAIFGTYLGQKMLISVKLKFPWAFHVLFAKSGNLVFSGQAGRNLTQKQMCLRPQKGRS